MKLEASEVTASLKLHDGSVLQLEPFILDICHTFPNGETLSSFGKPVSVTIGIDLAEPGTSCRTVRAIGEPVHVANELCDLGEQCRCKADNNGDCWNSKVGKV